MRITVRAEIEHDLPGTFRVSAHHTDAGVGSSNQRWRSSTRSSVERLSSTSVECLFSMTPLPGLRVRSPSSRRGPPSVRHHCPSQSRQHWCAASASAFGHRLGHRHHRRGCRKMPSEVRRPCTRRRRGGMPVPEHRRARRCALGAARRSPPDASLCAARRKRARNEVGVASRGGVLGQDNRHRH